MKIITNLIAGLAGSLALNIVHQAVAQFDWGAPRVDVVGEEALSKTIRKAGGNPPTGDKLFAATLVSDIISNTIYYSAIGSGKQKNLWSRGAIAGLTAGIGAVTLTAPLGLDDEPITKTKRAMAMTVGYYLLGGLVTAGVLQYLRGRQKL